MTRVSRRRLIALLGGAGAAWPLARPSLLRAEPRVPVVGHLGSRSPALSASAIADFRLGLEYTGFVDKQNVLIEHRWSDRYDRLAALAAEFAARKAALIFADDAPSLGAAKAATATIPIVFLIDTDPVEAGYVASLTRPAGNVTGATNLSRQLGAKRLGLIAELLPKAATVAVLVNPANANAAAEIADIEEAARALRLQLQLLHARSEREIDLAFAALAPANAQRPDGLLVVADPLFHACSRQLAALAVRHAAPAMHFVRDFPAAGGLMSYGPSIADSFRQVGFYAGRILKGAKPADLPVLQPSRFELVLNLKAAAALGLDLPATLVARADTVIE